MNLKLLAEPFPDIKTRPGPGGKQLSYIDARQLQNRLDEVVGPENWCNSYHLVGDHLVCRIGIKVDGEWVYKEDVGTESNIEEEKGIFSDALKRAGVQWSIARYLYDDAPPKASGTPPTDKMVKFYDDMLAKALESQEHSEAAAKLDARLHEQGGNFDAYSKGISWLKEKGFGN
jgi:hypothetical protein